MRSLAINPLFARYIYESIVINYCQTLVRTIAIVSVPSPFVFNFNGRQIRAHSTIAPVPDIEQDKKRDEEMWIGCGGELQTA